VEEVPSRRLKEKFHHSVDESFDPYRKWLGIPPEEQPPHHYRLLGLELFEEDADVIVNATDARLSFLRSVAKDKHADMADRLVAQIKEVQLCLLDPAKKAFYDGQLQRRMAALKKEPAATAATPNAAAIASPNGGSKWASTPVPPLPQPPSPAAGANNPPTSPAKNFTIPELHIPAYTPPTAHAPRERWRILAAMMLGLVALGCLLVYLLVKYKREDGTGEKPAVVRTDPNDEKSPAANSDPSTRRDDSPGGKPAENAANPTRDPDNESPRESGSPVIPPPMPNGIPTVIVPSGNAPDNLPPSHSGTAPAPNIENTNPANNSAPPSSLSGKANLLEEDFSRDAQPLPASQPAGERQPIPAETARRAAEKSVREIYAAQMAAAKNGMRRRALANRMWSQAIGTKDDAALRYALMAIAVQLLGESDQLQSAMERAESFAEYFAVNPWELKLLAIAQAAKSAQTARDKSVGDELVLLARQFAEQAKDAGQIEVADKTVKAVNPLAKKDPMLMREMNVFAREIERQMARYRPVRKALDVLKANPDDPDANALAGRWNCFEDRDWDEGLLMLAKSSDAALAALAAKDIAASKNEDGQSAVADAWWDFAQKEKGSVKAAALARAEHWYDRALPKLAGLDKAKAETRLKSLAGFDASAPPGRGAIQTGNVALASNGTRVEGVAANGEKLLDGDVQNPGWDGGAASGPVPCEWTITFDKVYLLQQIRFHFYDGDARFYHYVLAVSADGEHYKTLLERNQGQSFRWQVIPVKGLPVKSVKLFGTLSYKNQVFSVTEFEAYCIPPKR
jgi:hypothetical protein